MSQTEYDGALISEFGVKRYLKATKDIKTANIDFLIRGDAAQKAWQACNFGCHGPTYRSLKKPASRAGLLNHLNDISPALAGLVDGVHHRTTGQVERLAGGMERTADGLHLNGGERFGQVGDENTAALEFATGTFESLVTFEIDVIDNPVSQVVMASVSEYISALPEWLIEETFKQGVLKFPRNIDTRWLLRASAMGVVESTDQKAIIEAADLLKDPAQRMVGKQIGKRLAGTVGLLIATSITKRLLMTSPEVPRVKRDLVRLRRAAQKGKGGLGGALITLLNTQGLLHKAGESSRRLQSACPRLWRLLRYNLNGANMIYFLVEGMVHEYVDRLALLEQNPREFGKVVEALIREKRTQAIYFPNG
ncbi:cellulose-binding protein [Marinimicrobium locisalis]|uniref:cellulose-binding protein n=1 Tax=Marinimicrobium locisalis TaxID=546022 RepID=UPI0032220121